MAMAAKSFGRRPREDVVADKPAASLGAVLELLRALNWFIRADVPWPTERGQTFDFVLAGESGVFAVWVHDGDPLGIEDATAELGRLLGGIDVRPIVCRAVSSVTNAGSRILFCAPDTALDLLVGLPSYQGPTQIATIVNRLRDLVVPLPPEPRSAPAPMLPPTRAEKSVPRIEKSVVEPAEVEPPGPEKLAVGRHRSEKPRRTRRTPPPPPSAAREEPKLALELPTAIGSLAPRRKSENEAARRFDNNYVYVPPKVEQPGALRREFKLKPFAWGTIGLLIVALAVGVGIKEWPQIRGLTTEPSNPSASFGQSISVSSTNFHPSLTLTVTRPTPASANRGMVSYAVTLTALNTGSGPWQLPPRSAVTMTDSIGESGPVADIRGGRWGGSVKANGRWVGKLTFKIRSGRQPASLQFALASTNGETAIWK